MVDWDDRDFRSADENGGPELRETDPPSDENSSSTSFPASWTLFAAAGLALVAGLGLYWLFSARGVSVPPPRNSAPTEEALAEVAPRSSAFGNPARGRPPPVIPKRCFRPGACGGALAAPGDDINITE